ncbi:16S rRNA (guanine(966)-N(2))-methyltransferase RsmD [Candidatus Saccharibacteria bacterium]|nr:16S rRNA (guanine(966)-N(2))-methyltransferase RsmD [Candidatus Saccharibacteria bacterium]
MDKIRITSGELRGRTIKSPKSVLTHPMGSREKLALFNMIMAKLSEAVVLDAFAGSGALGIEALSRGAKTVYFVEKNSGVAKTLADNIKSLGLEDRSKVFRCEAANFEADVCFDIIIADPPYDNFDINDVVCLTKYLKDGGVFVLSHPGSAPVIEGLNLTNTHKYAAASISVYYK